MPAIVSLTTATIIKDPNADSSRVSSTTATITRDQNAGSSRVSSTTATRTKDTYAVSSLVSSPTATTELEGRMPVIANSSRLLQLQNYTAGQKAKHQTLALNFTKILTDFQTFFADGLGSKFARNLW